MSSPTAPGTGLFSLTASGCSVSEGLTFETAHGERYIWFNKFIFEVAQFDERWEIRPGKGEDKSIGWYKLAIFIFGVLSLNVDNTLGR